MTELLRQFSQTLDTIRDGKQLTPHEAIEFSYRAKQCFCVLGRKIIFTYSDKATNNFAIICKKHADMKLLQELKYIGNREILTAPRPQVFMQSLISPSPFSVHTPNKCLESQYPYDTAAFLTLHVLLNSLGHMLVYVG